MATKRKNKLKGISGIESNSTVIQRIPIGPRYHRFLVFAQGTGKTYKGMISEMRLMVNGHAQRTYTPDQLDICNSRNGPEFAFEDQGAGNASSMTIFLAEPWRKDPKTVDSYAWRSRGLDTFTLEIDTKAGLPADAKFWVIAESDESILRDEVTGKEARNQLPVISKVERKILPVIGQQVDQFDIESGELYQVISFLDPHIESVRLMVNKSIWYELTKQEADQMMTEHDLTPSDSIFAMVFDEDDAAGSSLPIGRGDVVEFLITFAAESEDDETTSFPRNVTVLLEKFGAPV